MVQYIQWLWLTPCGSILAYQSMGDLVYLDAAFAIFD